MISAKWLLIVFVSCTGAFAATSIPCESTAAFRSFVQTGSNVSNSYEDRVNALQKAASECVSSPLPYILLAKLTAMRGLFDDSERWTERGLRNAPENPELRLNKAIALLGGGDAREAIAVLSQLTPSGTREFYLGIAYRSLGEHRAAREAFARAYESGYKQPYILYQVVREDYSLADKESGLHDFQTLDEQFPDSLFVHLLLGDAYLARHQDDEAELEYREALKRAATVPIVYTKLGYVAFRRAQYSDAADLFHKAIQLDSNFAQAYVYLGLCLRRLGKNQEAISVFAAAIARDPNQPTAYSEEESAEIEVGRREDALRVLETAVKRFPSDAALHAKLASLLGRLGHAKEARLESERVHFLKDHNISASPPSDMTQSAMQEAGPWSDVTDETGTRPDHDFSATCVNANGTVCGETQDSTGSSETGRHSEALEHEAEWLRLSKDYKGALAVIESALKNNRNDPRLLLTQGEIYQESGDQVSAIRSFLGAEQAGDRSAAPLYFVGLSFFILREHDGLEEYFDRACRHFELAIQADPSYSRAVFMVGVVRAVRSDLAGAKLQFEAALRLNPENAYYRLYYGVLLHRMQDDQAAIKEMRTAESLSPSNATIHLQLGKVYLAADRLAEARGELETATRLNPELRTGYYALGTLYRRMGLTEQSERAFQKFKSLAAEDEPINDPAASILARSDGPETIKTAKAHP